MSITSGDVRKDFVLATVANHFGAPSKDQSIESLRNNERLIAFLDDANVNVLSASVEKMADGSVKYHIDNVTHVGKANDNVHIENIRMPLVYDDIDLDFDNLGGEYLSSSANYLVDAISDYITKDKDKILADNVKKMIDKNFDTLIC